MEIQFLGTSAGTPTRTRNMTACAIRSSGAKHWSLVDCAEGTQYRLQRTNLSPMSLRAIFITHLHGDHCYGLPGLLATAGMQGRTAPMTIVGAPLLRGMIEAIMAATELALPYPLVWMTPADLPGAGILPDLKVAATPLSHRIATHAYSFTEARVERKLDTEKLKSGGIASGPAWGDIQQGRGVVLPDGRQVAAEDFLLAPRKSRKIVIAGDNDRPELLAREAEDADLLVHEATYTEDILRKVGPGPQHSSAAMVARFAQQAGLRNLVLTHFSPRYQDRRVEQPTGPAPGLSLADIEAEARAHFTGELKLARDLDIFTLDRAGVLSLAPA